MKPLLITVFCLLCMNIKAQNLVTNSGFDINTGCPTQIGQVELADGWVNWSLTPDYFHSCSNTTSPSYGMPQNVRGFQEAHSGQSYMGLFTFSDLVPNSREFIGRELSTPLVPGQTYFVSLWVCNPEQLACSHASNNIGVRFTTVSNYSIANADTALNNAHFFTTTVINDTLNWNQLSGTFVADSAYTHIGVGNYFDDANTTLINGDPLSNYAYYLIDDVCVSTNPMDCSTVSSLVESPESILEIFPNPILEDLNIQVKKDFKGVMLIKDLTGKVVFEKDFSGALYSHHKFDISEIPKGYYFLNLIGEEFTTAKAFVKM